MIRTFHPENERLKRRYLQHAKVAKGLSETSLDRIAASIDRFQGLTGIKPFPKFHIELAIAFRNKLDQETNSRTGRPLSASTQKSVLADCKGFFMWLADQPGYRSRIRYADCEYFNLDNKSKAIANASRSPKYPSVEQVEHVLRTMPFGTPIQFRDRSIIAFMLITGARIDATRTAIVGSVDLTEKVFHQDPRDMNTKFSKTFETWFFPVSNFATQIVIDYIDQLKADQLFGPSDPLFPRTEIAHVPGKGFQATGLLRQHWKSDQAIREVFRTAFETAGLTYYAPHSLRHTLGAIGKDRCHSLEEQQAWAQNLGHDNAMTMIQHYGNVHPERQRDLVRNLKE